MKRLLTSSVGLLAAFAILAPAMADEPPPSKRRAVSPARAEPARAEPARAQASNWSGGQVGGSNGGSFANNAFAEPGSYVCPAGYPFGQTCFETPFSFTGNKASYTIGPFLGYRMQFGAMVVGVEGDVSYKSAEDSQYQNSTTYYAVASRIDDFYGSIKQGWDGSVRGRLGMLVTPWTLVYGTGGVAFGKVSGTLTYTGTAYDCANPIGCGLTSGVATSSTTFSETRVGYTVGAGAEMQLFGPWTARIEYRYTDLGKFSQHFPVNTVCGNNGCPENPSAGASIDLHPTFQTVRIGLGLGF